MSMSRDPEKEAFWRMVVQEQQKSNLSIRQFCRTEGLTESLFYAWRRELRRRDQEHTSAPIDLSTDAENNNRAACTDQLYPVRILENLAATRNPDSASLTIESPGGFQIHLFQPACTEMLGLALDAIRQSETRQTSEVPSPC